MAPFVRIRHKFNEKLSNVNEVVSTVELINRQGLGVQCTELHAVDISGGVGETNVSELDHLVDGDLELYVAALVVVLDGHVSVGLDVGRLLYLDNLVHYPVEVPFFGVGEVSEVEAEETGKVGVKVGGGGVELLLDPSNDNSDEATDWERVRPTASGRE